MTLARVHFAMDGSGFGDLSGKPILLGFACPDWVQVGSGVSEVLAAFVTTLASGSGLVPDVTPLPQVYFSEGRRETCLFRIGGSLFFFFIGQPFVFVHVQHSH